MLETFRRFVVIYAFLLWQGGFVVYGGVVVPIGSDQLGSDLAQGLITQRVSVWLNIFGVVWCLALGWDCLALKEDSWRGGMVVLCAGLLLALFPIHTMMTNLIDFDAESIADRRTFRRCHQVYLSISTLHWLLAMAVLWRTLRRWALAGENLLARRARDSIG
jgi:hypothetical protein